MAEINIKEMAKSVAKKVIQELRDDGVFVSRWIPVGERLPEEDDFYLVTAKVGNELIIDISEYTPKNDFWDIPHEIVAWIPLPKPYEPQESEET